VNAALQPGNYIGEILSHGTDTTGTGIPLVFVEVRLVAMLDGERRIPITPADVMCRGMLAGGTPEKSETAIRMTRAMLKLCGFDIDARDLNDLDAAPTYLKGVEVPVRVSEREYNGKFYPNYDIAPPRGVSKDRAKSLTEMLRAAKSKDEPPVTAAAKPSTPDVGVPEDPAARAALREKLKGPSFDDIPF